MKTIVAVLLALALAALANVASAATWEHFNADPAYPSREAAIADAPRVLRQAGYPEPAISLLTEAMKKPGVRTHVTNGMKLDFMRSGKSALWRNVEVKFKKPPMAASMEYSAPAEEWSVDLNGTTWTYGLPDVCNNSYGKRASAPTPPTSPPPLRTVTTTRGCPDGIFLQLDLFSEHAIREASGDLLRRANALVTVATKRDSKVASDRSAYVGDAFSRTLGDEIIGTVGVREQLKATADVNLLSTDSMKVVRQLGTFSFVDGIAMIPLNPDERKMPIESVWHEPRLKSPVMSGGKRRIVMEQDEWMNGRGGRYCVKHHVGFSLNRAAQ